MKTPGFGTASIKKVNADALPHRPVRSLLGGALTPRSGGIGIELPRTSSCLNAGHIRNEHMEGHELREAGGKNLKTYRFLWNVSQAELAKRTNISLTFLSDIERGNKWPYPETLFRTYQV
jgi:DNA-binding XRE family transcriptional regulator